MRLMSRKRIMGDDHDKASILEWEILNMKGSLSELLFSDDINLLCGGTHFTDLNLPPSNSPTILSFENPKHETNLKPNPRFPKPKATALKRKGDSVICPAKSPVGTSSKRMKLDNSVSTSSRHAKTRRQGMGERIAALQQLVSPYGKTDTASVLDEAKGYIKFLQQQVRVLCSPYLQVSPSTPQGVGSKRKNNLRSMGLCLVPATCCSNLHVANGNGADFWSPVTGINSSKCSSSVPRL